MTTVKLTIKDWIAKNFPPGSSHVPPYKVRGMIERGELKAQKIGRMWYILDEITTGDTECDEILRAIS